MVFDRRFAGGFVWRVALLIAAVLLFGGAMARDGLVAARIVAAALVIGAGWLMWHHVGRTNREIARFVAALRHGDLAQGFAPRGAGSGFDRLGAALDGAMRTLRRQRAEQQEEGRLQAALVEESPAALLAIEADGRVTLANRAARKLFRTARGTRPADFAAYGAPFVAALADDGPLPRGVMRLMIDGVAQRAMVTRAAIHLPGRPLRIISVQSIQAELSAVELTAQADLVRVLTHEIMNSMTPVVSLSATTARLMADIDDRAHPAVADAREASETLARRANGIMRFVETYRGFSDTLVIAHRRFAVSEWAGDLRRFVLAADYGAGAQVDVAIAPPDLRLEGDPDLLAQVVINLVKNGIEAARGIGAMPAVAIAIGLLPGGRTRIAITDNGPGIPPALADEVFLPFFTTKAGGSGVGLSLARRIVTAHGGTIAIPPDPPGGAVEITL